MPRKKPADSAILSAPWRARLDKLLRKTFGFKHLREGQDAVITSVMSGRPTLAIMPTGAGKSLCYQLPALLLPGCTVVVSPLIALMKDQCDKLREQGIEAVQLNSAVAADDRHAAETAIAEGRARIVFTTPERLADTGFLDLLGSQHVSLLVVDEAHCVSQWGHDFRPAFLEIGSAAARLGKPALLALTATATEAVIDDIARQLGVARFHVINTGLYRPNLRYRVEQVTNEGEKLARAVALVAAAEGSGLVYAATVKAAEAVHAALLDAGVEAAIYHGKLGPADRRSHQEAFMAGRARVMVATNAFGLGIDKPDTRFVLHYQMPAGLDAYYQESGRAGRDGKPADCTLLFLRSDKAVQQFFLAGKYPAREDLADLYMALHDTPPADEAKPAGAWTLRSLQAALERPQAKLQVGLRLLRHQGVVRQDREGRLALTRHGLDDDGLETLLEAYRKKRESDKAMLERMVFYGQTGHCRWKVLLENFGESAGFTACGNCDNCARVAMATEQALAEAARSSEVADAGEFSSVARRTKNPPAFAVGDPVRVPRYGLATVEAIGAEGIEVAFADGSRRVFLEGFVKPAQGRKRGGSRVQKLPQTMLAAA